LAIRNLSLEGASVCIVTEKSPRFHNTYFTHIKGDLHPAGVVRPPNWEVRQDRESCRGTAAAGSNLDPERWKVRASIVVQVKTARATTEFGAVRRANHRAIARRCRRTPVEYRRAAVYREKRGQRGGEVIENHIQHSSAYSTPASG